MKGLHQQLESKGRHIAADEATVARDEHLHETHLAKERLPRLRHEAAKLATDIELGEAAHQSLNIALTHMRTIDAGGRELSLAITEAETALWRLRNHLGQR
jgi:hypothetical protein